MQPFPETHSSQVHDARRLSGRPTLSGRSTVAYMIGAYSTPDRFYRPLEMGPCPPLTWTIDQAAAFRVEGCHIWDMRRLSR